MEGLPAPLTTLAEAAARGLEIAGVCVILLGVLMATAVWAWSTLRTRDYRGAYGRYRANLGRGILLGLEFLVGADIISTVTAPLTFESVGILAAVVAIRTFLSFSLETEIAGCWPWERARQRDSSDGSASPGSRAGSPSSRR